MAAGSLHDGYVPGRHIIDAYGNGGFRFAEMSHRGSILMLPSGVRAWAPVDARGIDRDALRRWLKEAGIGLDVMQTGAAARTYNILVAENRKVAAALVAVA